MSKLVADNLRAMTDAVETPMKYPVQGSAKAWMCLTGTGTIAIRNSLNTSSATDNGTGDYSENFTASMLTADYSAHNTSITNGLSNNLASQATGSVRVVSNQSGVGNTDSATITTTVVGTLA